MADNVVDNWESLGEDELEKRLRALDTHFPPPASASALQNEGIHRRSGSAPQLYVDLPRSYAQQPQSFRILKRQDMPSSSAASSQSHNVPSKPVRTLEEREAAYAEARLRIFGASGAAEDKNSKDDKVVKENSCDSVVAINGLRLPTNVSRLPKGPDGSKGFTAIRNPNR